MAELSILPLTCYGAEELQIKNYDRQNHCRPRTWSLIAAQGEGRYGMMCGSVTCCLDGRARCHTNTRLAT
jgi:hypothetical protein